MLSFQKDPFQYGTVNLALKLSAITDQQSKLKIQVFTSKPVGEMTVQCWV